MSLVQRKPRPLSKDAVSLRDDRLFIVACDDTYAPKQYFDFFRITRVRVHVVPTTDGSSVAERVLDRLLATEYEPDDQRWMLLDTDHTTRGEHLRSFTEAMRRARQSGIQVAISKPCFELWLLLHHVDQGAVLSLTNARKVEEALRTQLGTYDKRQLEEAHYPLHSVVQACQRAEALDLTVEGGEIPESNTSRVYLLWKAIVSKALASQLPPELQCLL